MLDDVQMEFRILGPLEVCHGRRLIRLAPQQRRLLAVLLCHAGTVVSADRLVDGLWASPPRTARKSLHVQLHHLRRALGDGDRVVRDDFGYSLMVQPGELDADRFEGLASQGRAALASGLTDAGVTNLRRALSLWRGSAYAGHEDLQDVAEEARRLNERRFGVEEELIDASITAGRHADVAARLADLVAEHPFREHLRGQLMIVLYRLGRQADALDVYREGRRVMAEELGLEPGSRLRELERAILTNDPALTAPTPGVRAGTNTRPREIPAGSALFVGRERDVTRLEELLISRPDNGPALVAVEGVGGVGKSALAVRVAHRIAEHFPDGQLYIDLQGSAVGLTPLQPAEVLKRFLRALGEDPRRIPTETMEAAAHFRSMVADRRILVVLDNATNVTQVRPLLPGSASCATLITSRRSLATLEGLNTHHRHRLDVLSERDALELLRELVGRARVQKEPAAAIRIVRMCGRTPLAIKIAGNRLSVRPSWPLSTLADRLSAERYRLDELRLDDMAVRASLSVSLDGARNDPGGEESVRLFALLGLPGWPEITVPVAAALSGLSAERAESALEHLADIRLLEIPSPRRYRIHDLVRLFAKETAQARLSDDETAAALDRALDHFVVAGRRITTVLHSGQALWLDDSSAHTDQRYLESMDLAESVAWLEAERSNIIAAIRQAADLPGSRAISAVRLANALSVPFRTHGAWGDRVTINEIAVEVAERLGEHEAEARARMFLGDAYSCVGRFDDAEAHIAGSLALARRLGDRLGESGALNAYGGLQARRGRHDEAIACFESSLAIRSDLGDASAEVMLLYNLGAVHQRAGRPARAVEFLEAAIALAPGTGETHRTADALGDLANAYRAMGDLNRATIHYTRSLALHEAAGHSIGAAGQLWGLGMVQRDLGNRARARELWDRAIAMLREVDAISPAEEQMLRDDPDPPAPVSIRLSLPAVASGSERAECSAARTTVCDLLHHAIAFRLSCKGL